MAGVVGGGGGRVAHFGEKLGESEIQKKIFRLKKMSSISLDEKIYLFLYYLFIFIRKKKVFERERFKRRRRAGGAVSVTSRGGRESFKGF